MGEFYDQEETLDTLKRLSRMQRDIRKGTKESQKNHMERMRTGACSAEAGIVFGDILNGLNRIGGHSINIAESSVAQE